MKKSCLLLFAALAAVPVSLTHAALLTLEDFNYTSGANITGQTGGSGWRTPVATYPYATSGTTGTINSTGLVYTTINPSYTAFSPSGLAANMGGAFRNHRLLQIDAGGIYDANGLRGGGNFIGGSTVTGTLWGSYLINASIWGTGSGPQALFNLISTAGTGTQTSIRQTGAGTAISVTDPFGASIGATGSIATSSLSTTNPNLFVFRYEFNGASDDTFSVWLNPTSASDTAAITATAANFIVNQPEFRSVSAAGNLVFDEIRFGTTFVDVVPVPEPSSWGLFALGLTLALRRHRRSLPV